jgi:flagellar biogenesis protein FliO
MNTASQVEQLQPIAGKPQPLRGIGDLTQTVLFRAWTTLKWIMQRVKVQQARKNLRVCESVSLGEKRFVAVVQIDSERFLIGGSSSSVSLLTRLQETTTFAAALEREAKTIS